MQIASTTPSAVTMDRTQTRIADGLEKAFLAEMLKYAGPKPMDGAFGGGVGEEQFSSMLTDTYATALAERMDLGLDARVRG